MRRCARGRRFLSESRYSLSVQADEACGAHSNVSCGPPRSEASARATLRVAKAQPNPRPKALPNANPILGPARHENRLRFSRPKNSRSPKHSPVLRPVSASLRLRCRSAAFAVARWDFISILLTAKRVKSPFRRAGDGFLHEIVFFAHSSFFARLRDSSIFGSRRNS